MKTDSKENGISGPSAARTAISSRKRPDSFSAHSEAFIAKRTRLLVDLQTINIYKYRNRYA